MPSKLDSIKVSLSDIEKIAKQAKISLEDLLKALQAIGEKGISPIRIFGATEETLKTFAKDLPELGRAYVRTIADIVAAHGDEQASVEKVRASYDAYTKQLRTTADLQRTAVLELKSGTSDTQINVPFTVPVFSEESLEGGREYNAVVNELIDRLGGSERGMRRAEEIARRYGMTLNNLVSAHTDAVNGVTSFNWRLDHGNGIIRTASMRVDRLGNTLEDTSTRFRGTTAMIERNIGKVMEWAVAVGVVYGVIRNLNQVIDNMREFETLFADIAIVTDESTASMVKFIGAINDAARSTGIVFRDVLAIFDDVLRATANISDEAERYATANQLLADSTAMARLANVDAARGYDMMLGALRQAGLELDRGSVLLDKWVAVSKNAGVSIEDMAQSFAITADIMGAAGVDIDHLNGLIATLAESTTLSATEVGNALRAMASTYTTERSIQVLNKYGISVQDLAGDYNDLWNILQQVAAMYETGILSESQVKAVAEAMGGGQRRAAQVMTIITHLARAHETAAVSADAQGDAEEALAVKMDTLQTAANQLTTAWQNFAATLGAEGGMLDLLTSMTNMFTNLADALSAATENLGPLTTGLIQLLTVYSAFRFISTTKFISDLTRKIGETTIPGAAVPYTGTAMNVVMKPGYEQTDWGVRAPSGQWTTRAEAYGFQPYAGVHPESMLYAPLTAAVGWLKDTKNLTGVFTTAAMVAAPLLTEGFTEEAVMKSAGTAIGSALGWAVMSKFAGPIGGMIGGAIAQAVISGWQEEERITTGQLGLLPEADLLERLEIQERRLRELQQGGPGRRLGVSPAIAGRIREIQADIEATKAALEDRKAAVEDEISIEENLWQEFYKQVSKVEEEYMSRVPTVYEVKLEAIKKLAAGDITRKEFNDMIKGAEVATASMGTLWHFLGEQIEDELGQSFEEVFDIIVHGSQESLAFFSGNLSEIARLTIDTQRIYEEIGQELDEHPMVLYEAYQQINRNNAARERELAIVKELLGLLEKEATIVPDVMKFDISQSELQEALQVAYDMMVRFAKFAGIEISELWEDAVYYAFTNDDLLNRIDKKYNRQFVQWGIQASQAFASQFNLERLTDVGPERWPEIVERTRYWEELFRRIGKPVEQEPITLILGEQNEIRVLYAALDALRYALDDLREVEEKRMLEGMWNIPSGATFMVPITSLFYQRMGGGGGGGLPPLPPYGSGAGMTGTGMTGVADSAVAATSGLTEVGKSAQIAASKLALLEGVEPRTPADIAVDVSNAVQNLETRLASLLQWFGDQGITAGTGLAGSRETVVTSAMIAEMRELLSRPWADTYRDVFESGKSIAEMLTAEVTVEIPPVQGEFEITNRIYLDGKHIYDYITRLFAQSLRRASKGGVTESPKSGWY